MTAPQPKVTTHQVLQVYARSRPGQGFLVDQELVRVTGQPWKVCYRAMERVAAKGLIDCGVSLRSGWLTDKGRASLIASDGADAAPAGDQTD